MRVRLLWAMAKLLSENVALKKKKDKLEQELSNIHRKYDKELADLEKKLEKKYKDMSKRNEILSEDNRRLACIVRRYEKGSDNNGSIRSNAKNISSTIQKEKRKRK